MRAVARAKAAAALAGCDELLAFATSALRDAENSAAVLARVRAETGVGLQVLSGEDEARYTFLAVRRWYGWSAGRLLVLDIGGGSLELAAGRDEDPEVALSLPLGAGRLTRQRLTGDPPDARATSTRSPEDLDAALAPVARQIREAGPYELAVGTSKTFRSLARLAGAAPSSAGLRTRRTLTDVGLHQLFGFISRMASPDLGDPGRRQPRPRPPARGRRPGGPAPRCRRCRSASCRSVPWALREGVILRRLDTLGVPTRSERPWPLTDTDPDRGDDIAQPRR